MMATQCQKHVHIMTQTLNQPELLSGNRQLDLFPRLFLPPDSYTTGHNSVL